MSIVCCYVHFLDFTVDDLDLNLNFEELTTSLPHDTINYDTNPNVWLEA